MYIKRMFAALFVAVTITGYAQLNVTLRGQLAYPGQTCANIAGYVDGAGNEYALVGASQGMSIVDITDPDFPVEKLQIPNVDNLWKEIKVRGNYAYVTTEGGGGLQIVNLTSLPSVAGVTYQHYTGDGVIAGALNTIHALHIDGNYCYLYGTNLFGGGAIVLDLADPWNPVYLGNYQNPASAYVHDGYVRNDTLYAGHIYAGFFSIVDFTNKSAPVTLAMQNTPTNFTHNTWLSQDSRYLFTTDENNDSYLTAYDVSDPANIIEVDKIQSNPGSNSVVHNTHIINVGGNDYAVTSWYTDGFTIVDAGRPINLVQVGNYDTYAGSGPGFNGDWGVYPYFPSGTIVVSNIDEGLFVFTPNYTRACYLEGTVTDSACGVFLNNVDITITAAGINEQTDIAGVYRTGTPAAGTYTVTYSKSGYVTKTLTGVVLSPGVVNVQNVALVPNNTFNLTGNVIEQPAGTPVNNAVVLITNAANTYNFNSDAAGNFGACNVVAANDYYVFAAKWGYNPVCLTSQTLDLSNSAPVLELSPGYYDDFALDLGWTVTGDATTGIWTRTVPVGTFNSGAPANPGNDVGTDCSNICYVTGNSTSGGASAEDVDGGTTNLISPVFDLTTTVNPYVEYDRWFYTGGGGGVGTFNDSLSVFLSNGTTTVLLESVKQDTPGLSTWAHKSFRVADFLTPTATMQIRVTTADNDPGHLVEAGFDKFFVTASPGGISEGNDKPTAFVYPNPFSEKVTVVYSARPGAENRLVLTDLAGRILIDQPVGDRGEVTITPSVPAGMYLLTIISDGVAGAPAKLIRN